MDDLIARTRAAMDEEERIAKAACHAGKGDWRLRYPNADNPTDFGNSSIEDEDGSTVAYDEGAPTLEEAAHIIKQNPKRTLRRIARDRKLLDLHQIEFFPPRLNVYTGRMEWPLGRWVCSVCSERRDGVEQLADGQACPTALAIAEDYEIEVQA